MSEESSDPNYIIEYGYDISKHEHGSTLFFLERVPASFRVRPATYHWFEVLVHNILKFFWITSTIFNIDEELHAEGKRLLAEYNESSTCAKSDNPSIK